MIEINKKNARIWSMLGMRRVLGIMLSELVEQDDRFVFINADVARYFGAEKFAEQYPEHYIDVGIAEQNMITVAAGMQKEGFNTMTATYATFTTSRALDQIRDSLAYMTIPVKMIGVGGGLGEGDLGATHMGLEDVSNIRTLPGITIVEPADCVELIKTLQSMINYNHPVYIRMTGKTNQPMIYKEDYHFKIGKANVLRQGNSRITLICAGTITAQALKAADTLKKEHNLDVDVIDMHTIKPLDTDMLNDLSSPNNTIIVLEEHMKVGGLGSAVVEYYAGRTEHPRVIVQGIEDYPRANDYKELLKQVMMDSEGICKTVLNEVS